MERLIPLYRPSFIDFNALASVASRYPIEGALYTRHAQSTKPCSKSSLTYLTNKLCAQASLNRLSICQATTQCRIEEVVHVHETFLVRSYRRHTSWSDGYRFDEVTQWYSSMDTLCIRQNSSIDATSITFPPHQMAAGFLLDVMYQSLVKRLFRELGSAVPLHRRLPVWIDACYLFNILVPLAIRSNQALQPPFHYLTFC